VRLKGVHQHTPAHNIFPIFQSIVLVSVDQRECVRYNSLTFKNCRWSIERIISERLSLTYAPKSKNPGNLRISSWAHRLIIIPRLSAGILIRPTCFRLRATYLHLQDIGIRQIYRGLSYGKSIEHSASTAHVSKRIMHRFAVGIIQCDMNG
jgi:hypothetical protein